MTEPNADARFDLYVVRVFFDAETCVEFIDEIAAHSRPGHGLRAGRLGCVDERVRKAARLMPARETFEHCQARLLECRGEVGEHFGVSLGGLRRAAVPKLPGGRLLRRHQDGNTGMILSEREQSRRVSVVIFLNRQSEAPEADAYGGGALVFSDWRAGQGRVEFRLSGEAGTLVAFRSETTHEVVPVTHGERYSIVSWYE